MMTFTYDGRTQGGGTFNQIGATFSNDLVNWASQGSATLLPKRSSHGVSAKSERPAIQELRGRYDVDRLGSCDRLVSIHLYR
jgi:hypothetical protein